MRKSAVAIAALLLAGCVSRVTGPPASAQANCERTAFPTNDRIAAWSVDKFAGRYKRGDESLTVRRNDHRLLVEGWTLGTRELGADNVESWTWRDACAVRYDFTLPPDGPGAWLKITTPGGTTTDWHRETG